MRKIIALFLCAVLFAGCSTIDREPSAEGAWEDRLIFDWCGSCDKCNTKTPEEYLEEIGTAVLCPDCGYDVLEREIDLLLGDETGKCYRCNQMFYLSDSETGRLCYECEDNSTTDCVVCGYITEYMYGGFEGLFYGFCGECAAEAMNHSEVRGAVYHVFDME